MAPPPERTWNVPALERRELSAPDASLHDTVETWIANDGDLLHGLRDGDHFWLWSPDLVTFRFTEDGPVEYDPAQGLECAAREFWTRSAMPLAVQARGRQVLHASALVVPKGVIAFCGRSTAGKSTLVQAAQAQGLLHVIADDSLAFEATHKRVDAMTLPFEVRLRPAAAAVLDPEPASGEGGDVLPVALIILIDRDDETDAPEVTPVAPTEALGALMPHAYCFSLTTGKEALVRAYAQLTERVPVVRLSFRRELDALPEVVDAIRTLARGL